jgi:hypothetical protein
MPVIPFSEFRPDMPDLGQWSREALNCVPAEESYRPFPSLVTATNALDARCQGAAWFRDTTGGVKMFAGDATKLYLLADQTWSDVSRTVGGAYAPGNDGSWRFAQFGSLAIGVNGVDTPQKFDLAAGTRFVVLGGSPPTGTFIAVVRDFVVLGKIGVTPQRVQWSGFNNAETTWGTVAATQADFQDLPDGGNVTGIVGGEFGVVFSETAVRRMSYEGPPLVFRFDKIANDIGCSVPNSIASISDRAFFLHKSGFFMVVRGQEIVPIGRGKIDRTFWSGFDEAAYFNCSAAIDPVRSLYIFAYSSGTAGSTATPNRLAIYNWVTERWSRAVLDSELVFNGISHQDYTLEELDAFGDLDSLPYSLDSSYWSGSRSLLLYGFYTDHKSGSFSGPALAATVETAELNTGNGSRSVIRGCRPLIDGGAPRIRAGFRETQQSTVAWGPEVGLTPAGMAPVLGSGRYVRIRATMAAGETWANMQGVDDLDVRKSGGQ